MAVTDRMAGPDPRVLVVSATRAEAAYVPEGVEVLITGMGKVAAATALADRLARLAASDEARGVPALTGLRVLNVGTAGALRDGLVGVFTPGLVVNHDLSADAVRALGYEVTDELTRGVDQDVVLATGDQFVSDPVQRDRLARRAHLVDMEGYAVAWACDRAGVPWLLVKHVSDNADDSALAWADVVDASARELGEWLTGHLG